MSFTIRITKSRIKTRRVRSKVVQVSQRTSLSLSRQRLPQTRARARGSVVMLAVLDFIATHTGVFSLTVLVVYVAAVLLGDQRSGPESHVAQRR